MTTASFDPPGGAQPAYRVWRFTDLTEQELQAEAEPEQPMVSATEVEAIRARAREEGYTAGFRAGRDDGRQSVVDEVEHLRRLAEALSRARVELLEESAQALLALSVDIARQVLRSELASHPDAILPAIRETLSLAGRADHPQLCLNPGDVDIVRRHLGDDLDANQWRICEDTRIEPGGCRVVTGDGTIDATLGTRWKRALASLGQEAPAHEGGAADA